MRDTHVQEFVTMRHPKQGNLAFTTNTASHQRLNVHACIQPRSQALSPFPPWERGWQLSRFRLSSVKENN